MYTQKKPIDNAHIVRERDRQRFRELLAVLCLGVPIGLFLLLFTWQNLEVIRLGRQATELQQKRKQISDTNKALQLEVDRLTSLDAVERKATALGFATTDPQMIVMVVGGQGSVVGANDLTRQPLSATSSEPRPPSPDPHVAPEARQ
jgi:cell division protein FtsB